MLITKALTKTMGNKKQACVLLGISQTNLYKKMKKHGIKMRNRNREPFSYMGNNSIQLSRKN